MIIGRPASVNRKAAAKGVEQQKKAATYAPYTVSVNANMRLAVCRHLLTAISSCVLINKTSQISRCLQEVNQAFRNFRGPEDMARSGPLAPTSRMDRSGRFCGEPVWRDRGLGNGGPWCHCSGRTSARVEVVRETAANRPMARSTSRSSPLSPPPRCATS
jgi:hypothetical protein